MIVQRVVTDLINQLTCAIGYLDLEDYAKARKAMMSAIKLMNTLRPWLSILAVTEDREHRVS